MTIYAMENVRQYVRERLADKTVGYQLCVVNTAVKVSHPARRMRDKNGLAIRKWDPILISPEGSAYYNTGVKMGNTRRLEINSMSKTITAAAVMKLLHENDPVELDSSVVDYLPNYWNRTGVENLRIGHLLTHQSGLTEHDQNGEEIFRIPGGKHVYPCYYGNIKKTVKLGSVGIDKDRFYQNVNYGLFRLMIPYMRNRIFWTYKCRAWGLCNSEDTPVEDEDVPADTEWRFNWELSGRYVTFVRDQVLAPCGVQNADVDSPPSGLPNRYYNLKDSSEPPRNDIHRAFRCCGSQGWKLSAEEYCRFLVGLSSGTLFPVERWKTMLSLQIGLRHWLSGGRLYYGHSGEGYWQTSGWVFVPTTEDHGVFMALLTNSRDKGDYDLENLPEFLGKAYDECF